jgi:hypothetical protein
MWPTFFFVFSVVLIEFWQMGNEEIANPQIYTHPTFKYEQNKSPFKLNQMM